MCSPPYSAISISFRRSCSCGMDRYLRSTESTGLLYHASRTGSEYGVQPLYLGNTRSAQTPLTGDQPRREWDRSSHIHASGVDRGKTFSKPPVIHQLDQSHRSARTTPTPALDKRIMAVLQVNEAFRLFICVVPIMYYKSHESVGDFPCVFLDTGTQRQTS